MLLARSLLLLLAFFLASSLSHGQDFSAGESVVVTTESVDVQSKQEKLGSIPRGTKFKIRQKTASWFLGEFRIGNKTVLGWVPKRAVRHMNRGSATPKPHDFTWDNLLYAWVKLDKYFDYDAHIDDYMKAFRPTVWKKYRNDEFQLEKKQAEALRMFQERVEGFDLGREFVIRATLTMEKYDFDRSAFPIKEATDHNYWYESRYTGSEFPTKFKAFFDNPDSIEQMLMSSDAAEHFLSTRKSRSGSIDRRIYTNIYVRLRSMKGNRGELWAEVRWAQYFADNNRTKLLYQTPKPPPEDQEPPEAPASEEAPKLDANIPADDSDE